MALAVSIEFTASVPSTVQFAIDNIPASNLMRGEAPLKADYGLPDKQYVTEINSDEPLVADFELVLGQKYRMHYVWSDVEPPTYAQ